MSHYLDFHSLGVFNGVAGVAVRTVLLTFSYLLFTEFQLRLYNRMHAWKLLTRVQRGAAPESRDLLQVSVSVISVVLPIAIYLTAHSQRLRSKESFQVDVTSMFALIAALLVVQDTWYFWGHRLMHINKFLWHHVHMHHHEKRNLNVFATGYAAFVENLVLIAPVFVGVLAAYDYVSPVFNRLSFLMAVLTQMAIFNMGHSGFKHCVALWGIVPLVFVQQLPSWFGIRVSQRSTDHEMHHLFPQCNYSLNFCAWDKLMGTYKPIETIEAQLSRDIDHEHAPPRASRS